MIDPVDSDFSELTHLISEHNALMRSVSPEESCHVMTIDELRNSDVVLFKATEEKSVLGMGAILKIGRKHGEVKSMHVQETQRGRGIGRLILRRLIEKSRSFDWHRLSLETGSTVEFKAARTLYVSEGFSDCAPFGNYVEDRFSTFMSRTL
ncbi:MAG: GNAT family N-acetyltransferase [Aestuariivita sp.]|nr:GNAT family N-acetyltransferase [Aestuariivita sp.]